jgi:hypothetical protein
MADLLARQGAATARPYSLARDNQLRTLLEEAHRYQGNGIVSGGAVTQTAAFTVELATATVVLVNGAPYTLTAAVSRSGLDPSTTNYVWGVLTRTAADQTLAANLDTYAFALSHNTTGSRPSTDHIPIAVVTTDGSGITAVREPADKYTRLTWLGSRNTVEAWEELRVPAGHTQVVYGTFTIYGDLTIDGTLRIEA